MKHVFGQTQSISDPCIFFCRRGENLTIVIVFVDDGLICSTIKEVTTAMAEFLCTEFEMRIMPVDRFLGLNIVRNRAQRQLHLSQSHFTTAVLNKFHMDNCNPKAIASEPGARLSVSMSPTVEEEQEEMKKVPYKEAVGSLIYLAVLTLPTLLHK